MNESMNSEQISKFSMNMMSDITKKTVKPVIKKTLTVAEKKKIRVDLFSFLEERVKDISLAFTTEEIMKIKMECASRLVKNKEVISQIEFGASIETIILI